MDFFRHRSYRENRALYQIELKERKIDVTACSNEELLSIKSKIKADNSQLMVKAIVAFLVGLSFTIFLFWMISRVFLEKYF